jgi:hypothetical protein
MLGWVLFQSATDLSRPVTQPQRVNFTGPLEVLLLPELELELPPPPPQAARGVKINSRTLSMAIFTTKPRVQRIEKRYCIF